MNILTHFFVSWSMATPLSEKRDRLLVTLGGIYPDLDGIGVLPEMISRGEIPWFSRYHHLLGHNIGAGLTGLLLVVLLARRKIRTAGLFFIAFHLHLLGDIVGARGPDGYQWPIPYLLPLSDVLQITWVHQWALNAWPNFLVTFVALGWTFYFATRAGISPLELVSSRANTLFVVTLRNRFKRT